MSEEALRHEVVCFDGALNVLAVNADRHSHKHVLRALGDFTINAQEVGTFERLEAKVVLQLKCQPGFCTAKRVSARR